VVLAVPRQEGDPPARDLADEHRLTRLAERCLDADLFGVGQELIEARPADNPDVRGRLRVVRRGVPPGGISHRGQATFSPEDPPEDAELAEEDDADESLPDVEDDDESDEDEEEEEEEEEDDDADDEPLPFDEDAALGEPLLRLSVR